MKASATMRLPEATLAVQEVIRAMPWIESPDLLCRGGHLFYINSCPLFPCFMILSVTLLRERGKFD